jgi:hypothetical protein
VSEYPDDNSLEGTLEHEAQQSGGDTEEVDALLVSSELQIAEPPYTTLPVRSPLAASQVALTAAVAATGFAAGAALVGLAHRRHQSPARVRSRRLRGRSEHSGVREIAQIVGSRSFLVDVHLLGGTGRDR